MSATILLGAAAVICALAVAARVNVPAGFAALALFWSVYGLVDLAQAEPFLVAFDAVMAVGSAWLAVMFLAAGRAEL